MFDNRNNKVVVIIVVIDKKKVRPFQGLKESEKNKG